MLNISLCVDGVWYDAINDLYCIPKKFNVGIAEPKTNYVQVPYRNGSLDMSEALTGITYKNREIAIPLLILHPEPLAVYDLVSNRFNGKKCKIRLFESLESQSEYYYEGRIRVGTLLTNDSKWEFDIFMNAFPFKMRDVLIYVDGATTKSITNEGIDTVPTITVETAMQGTWNGESFTLAVGIHNPHSMVLKTGANTLVVAQGAGKVEFAEKRL